MDARAYLACSEYRCRSFGANCDFINKGTAFESCVTTGSDDAVSPVIQPYPEVFDTHYTFEPFSTGGLTGFKVRNTPRDDGKIPSYHKIRIGVQTDEPAQCKMSLTKNTAFKDMSPTYFGNNLFTYYHSQELSYPQMDTNQSSLTIGGGGVYELAVRCQDTNGNANEKDYVIVFTVAPEKDLTPPVIEGSTVGSTIALKAGLDATALDLFVNEPATCRWSLHDTDYDEMKETQFCHAQSLDTSTGLYLCHFTDADQDTELGSPAPQFNLGAGQQGFAYFKCKDSAGNKNPTSFLLTYKGSAPLSIVSVAPEGTSEVPPGEQQLLLRVMTAGGMDGAGSATCAFTTDVSKKETYSAMVPFLSTGTAEHTQPLEKLSAGVSYTYYITCQDVAGNQDHTETTFSVTVDEQAPSLVKVYVDDSSVPSLVTLETTEEGECRYSTEDFLYDEGSIFTVMDPRVYQTIKEAGKDYYIRCRDAYGNAMAQPLILFFN